jgi:hypothetical protein
MRVPMIQRTRAESTFRALSPALTWLALTGWSLFVLILALWGAIDLIGIAFGLNEGL